MRGHADNDRRKKRVQLLLSKIIQIPVSMLLLHCYGEEKKLEWKIAHHMFKKSRWNIIKYINDTHTIQIFAHTYKKKLFASFIWKLLLLNCFWKLEYFWTIFCGLINTNMYILRAEYIEILIRYYISHTHQSSARIRYYTFFLILFKCKIYPEKKICDWPFRIYVEMCTK